MSMLAEKRTKKKWCLNPNGKDWSNDNNKFGQRMLEKMGWKKGCGLGVNLQGMKEHVRVSVKTDTKGLGCKINDNSEWIHQQKNFESLLSELACTTFDETRPPGPSENKPVSLEEKSKNSRVRVHYQKFTRGKDVSRYSANDLACIFGKKCGSLGSKLSKIQYSSHSNAKNTSEADSEGSMISDEHKVGQSFNLCKEKPSDLSLPSVLHKHRIKDQPVYYSPEDKDVQEKQNDNLKEISNVKENSATDMDVVQELKSKIEDNSTSYIWPEPVKKIRCKRKRKHVKDSGNKQETITETKLSRTQEEVNELDIVAYEAEETDNVGKKERKKKKKDKKNKSKAGDGNGKEGNTTCRTTIGITSDAEEVRNEELEYANVTSEADTGGSKIKMKEICGAYKTYIPNEHKEHPEMKKKKKKKMTTQSLNEPHVLESITCEFISPLSQDKIDEINNTQWLTGFTSESFSSYREDPHQYDSNSAAKHRKAIKKLHRQNVETGFIGSNLDSIVGYGNSGLYHTNMLMKKTFNATQINFFNATRQTE